MRGLSAFVLAAAAALASSVARPHARPPVPAVPPVWPTEFEGRRLVSEALTARETRLGAGFAGSIARFSDGERQYVLRWLEGVPRGYHSAIDCYRGLGFAIEPQPRWLDAGGRAWSAFEAVRGAERLRGLERVETATATRAWTEPTDWFVDALLGRVEEPCVAWLIVERAAPH
jgi:hypothetical protein